MANSYIIFFQTVLLCCFCNLVRSQDTRDSYSARLGDLSFTTSCPSENASVSYQNNVNLLLSNFDQFSSLTSYYNASIGEIPNRVGGYFMCRADASLQVCNSCVANGTRMRTGTTGGGSSTCGQVSGGFITEMCIFQYANHSSNEIWDPNAPLFFDHFDANVSNPEQFNRTLFSTLEAVIDEAAFGSNNNGSRLSYATVEANVTSQETIYSLAQCAPNIAGVNCSGCLQSALSESRSSVNGAPAAVAILAECQLRYDNISFYDLASLET